MYEGPLIIGISGKIGSGKDRLVEMLTEEFRSRGQQVDHIKFADNLKKITSLITGTPLEDSYSRQGKAKVVPIFEKTIGTLQQEIGMMFREHLHPDVWLIPVAMRAIENASRGIITFISDVRFVNEALMIKGLSTDSKYKTDDTSVLIRLNRKDTGCFQDGRDKEHESETALDHFAEFDLVVDNNSSEEALKNVVYAYLTLFPKYGKDKESKSEENSQ